jgi:hypothetical protein
MDGTYTEMQRHKHQQSLNGDFTAVSEYTSRGVGSLFGFSSVHVSEMAKRQKGDAEYLYVSHRDISRTRSASHKQAKGFYCLPAGRQDK